MIVAKTLETQDLKFGICVKTLKTQNPEPQNFDVLRLLKSLDPTPFNTEFHAEHCAKEFTRR